MKKLLFLINPLSGSGKGALLAAEIASEMKKRMPAGRYDIVHTEPDASTQARALADGYETVLMAGGDGTLSRIARGLISLPVQPRLGIIPLGTGNDCARALGVLALWQRAGLRAIIDLALSGSTRPVDLLGFGTKHVCINYAGIGRDAAIAATFNRLRRSAAVRALCARGGSKPLYALLSLACARQQCAPDLELHHEKADGTAETLQFRQPLCQLLITNISSYGAGARVSSTSRMDDAVFEVVIMRSNVRWVLLHLTRLTGRAYDRPPFPGEVIQTRELTLNPGACSSAQIDGETVALEPGAPLSVRAVARLQIIAAPQS